MKNVLKPDDVQEGMIVYDSEGKKGKVHDCKDLHNVHVVFEGEGIVVSWYGEPIECGGSGLYCLVKSCEFYHEKTSDKLYF